MDSQTFEFNCIFSPAKMHQLAASYKDTREPLAMAAGQRLRGGDFRKETLTPIVEWKAERALHHILSNDDADVEDALRSMHDCKRERARVAVLRGLRGVEIPMASAILTAYAPEVFTVIDWRALASLGQPRPKYYSIDFYLAYLAFCRIDADRVGLSLRNYDRALWWGSKSEL